MKANMLKVAVLMMFVSLSTSTRANLITNGGFELPDVKHDCWRWFVSDRVVGWFGSNIEVWDHLNGFVAFEGDQHIELNAHRGGKNAYSIYQVFNTSINEFYTLSFAYSARVSLNETFLVEVESLFETPTEGTPASLDNTTAPLADVVILSELVDDHVIGSWSEFSTTFQAESDQSVIRFTSVIPYHGSVGNFIDAVQVKHLPQSQQSVSVDEPSVFILMLFTLFVTLKLSANSKTKKKRINE